MVNRQLKPAELLAIIRRQARGRDLTVSAIKRRDKGSHQMYKIENADGAVVARFAITGHPRDISAGILNQVEMRLVPLFGTGWMDK